MEQTIVPRLPVLPKHLKGAGRGRGPGAGGRGAGGRGPGGWDSKVEACEKMQILASCTSGLMDTPSGAARLSFRPGSGLFLIRVHLCSSVAHMVLFFALDR